MYNDIGVERTMGGNIRAGETHLFRLQLPKGIVARVALSQFETDLAIDTPGVHVDTNEYGEEIAFLRSESETGTIFRVSAGPNEPHTGRFQLHVTAIAGDANLINQRLAAQQSEMEGLTLLKRRRADTNGAAAAKLEEAAELWKKSGESHREGFCRLSLGRALERVSRLRAADESYLRAITLLRESGDVGGRLDAEKAWMNLGGHVGEDRGSMAALERLLREAKEQGDRRSIGGFLASLASAHHKSGHLSEARDLLASAIQIFDAIGLQSKRAEQLVRLSGMEGSARDFEAALRFARQAVAAYRELRDEGGELSALGGMGSALGALNRLEEAAAIYSDIRNRLKERGDVSGALSPAIFLTDIALRLGNHETARNLLIEAHDAMDLHYRRTQYPSGHFAVFGQTAFSYVASSMSDSGESFARDAFWLVDAQRSRFYTGDGKNRVRELQSLLSADTILLEYSLNQNQGGQGYVWAVERDSVTAHKIPASAEAVRLGREVVARLSDTRNAVRPENSILRRLSELLLGPVRKQIAGKRLIFVVDEFLFQLPMGLLPDPNESEPVMLGERHEIIYAPGGQAVSELTRLPRGPATSTIVVVADPVTNGLDARLRRPLPQSVSDFPRLAYAEEEIRRFRAAGWRNPMVELSGFEANRGTVWSHLVHAGFVHFIVHGRIDLNIPGQSGLALNSFRPSGERQDGFLRFDEIAGSQIAADIVSLAACDTAVGKVIEKFGVPTISSAFLRAGARRTVSTLWKIDDDATQELMVEFYKQLFSSAKLTPAQALWTAQMHVRKRPGWSNPYYWAGFVLSGDWRPL